MDAPGSSRDAAKPAESVGGAGRKGSLTGTVSVVLRGICRSSRLFLNPEFLRSFGFTRSILRAGKTSCPFGQEACGSTNHRGESMP